HGDVCLSWGRWGEFVGGCGSGGDGLESGGSDVMADGRKSGYQREQCTFQTGRDKVVLVFFTFSPCS
nr:hypothetical protein [Tanacetum cinerariifolium]